MTTRMLPLLTALILVLAACGGAQPGASDPSSDPPDETQAAATDAPAEGEATSVFELNAGDCFDNEDEGIIEEVVRLDCASSHEYELYAAVDHSAGADEAFPGDTDMTAFAESECIERFDGFVGASYETSELFIYYLQPTADTWAEGDREVLCALYLPDSDLEGSMEGSGR